MPPYCEEHAMYHGPFPGECQRMRAKARREAKATARRERAEQIAREAVAARAQDARHTFRFGTPVDAFTLAREIATAAALQALTETENAR